MKESRGKGWDCTVISEANSFLSNLDERCSFSSRSLSSLISFLEESSNNENSVLTRSRVSRNSLFVALSFSRASVWICATASSARVVASTKAFCNPTIAVYNQYNPQRNLHSDSEILEQTADTQTLKYKLHNPRK